MKKFFIYTILFLLPFILVTIGILIYFKITQSLKNTKVDLPRLPAISINDLVKYSRFSLEKAPTQSLVGNITNLEGTILFESRLATESAKIIKPQEIQQGEELATLGDGKLTLDFKDVAQINMAENSDLSVVQTLPSNLVFRQKLGSVEYKKLGQIPLSVRVGHLLIDTNATTNVSFTADSPITTVTQINGIALIAYNDLENNSNVINLLAGQTLTFNEAKRDSKINQ